MTILAVNGGASGGVWACRPTGLPEFLAPAPFASFALELPDGDVLVLSGEEDGQLRRFTMRGSTLVESQVVSAGGGWPCYAAADPSGRYLVVASYDPAAVAVFDLESELAETSRLVLPEAGSRVEAKRQEKSHPHATVFVRGGRLLVTDLGSDAILVCGLIDGIISHTSTARTPPGSGPRHLAVADGAVAVTAELSNEILIATLDAVLDINGIPDWTRLPAHPTASTSASRNYPGDIIATNAGSFLVANRGANTVTEVRTLGSAVHSVTESEVSGRWPQCLLESDDSLLVAARDDGVILRNGRPQWLLEAPVWITGS